MPYNPYNSIRKKKKTEVHELLLVECDKDREFFQSIQDQTGNKFIISPCKCT